MRENVIDSVAIERPDPAAVTTGPAAQGAQGTTMRILSTDECYRLLGTQQLGRIGINAQHYPLIFPVNYAMDRGVVVIKTAPGTAVAAADHANVSFEVDEIDHLTCSGWSVLVRGLAEHVTSDHSDELIAHTESTAVRPWAPGERKHWIRIIPHEISGRRIVPDEIPAWIGATGYL